MIGSTVHKFRSRHCPTTAAAIPRAARTRSYKLRQALRQSPHQPIRHSTLVRCVVQAHYPDLSKEIYEPEPAPCNRHFLPTSPARAACRIPRQTAFTWELQLIALNCAIEMKKNEIPARMCSCLWPATRHPPHVRLKPRVSRDPAYGQI